MARARLALPRRVCGTRCEVLLLRARSHYPRRPREAVRESVLSICPTGLASRFDNGNPHGFSGFVEANSRCYLSQFWAAVPR